MKKFIFVLWMISIACYASDLYPANTDYSFDGLEVWSQPRMASGTITPNVASAAEGDFFLNTATPSSPMLKVKISNAWRDIGSGEVAQSSFQCQRIVASETGSLFPLSFSVDDPSKTSLSLNGLSGNYPDNYLFSGSSTLDLGTSVPSGTVLIFQKF